MSNMALDIYRMVADGKGWEDVFVSLLQRGLIKESEKHAIRRYVLGVDTRALQVRKIAP